MSFKLFFQENEIQKKWLAENAFESPYLADMNGVKKYYALVMLPYPSGRIHMGHVRNYTIGDVLARFRRMRGDKVCHPLGWDAFGLPAENAAIERGVHPAEWTKRNIEDMKTQIMKMGISYDWSREITTCFPDFYRWNQWLFLRMWARGDVFRAVRNVNWCEALGTVLANEQVIDGKYERTGDVVVQKPMMQYFLRITKYADELLNDLDDLDWPENVKAMQRHWIGRSEGAKLRFELVGSGELIEVFTTRLDTLFGVSFMALSTEHPLIAEAAKSDAGLRDFCGRIAAMSREDRLVCETKEGFRTALCVRHPFTGAEIPVFAANYVLMDYGSGAVMGVPAHDERDDEFARKYGLPVVRVIESEVPWDKGVLINSGQFNGLSSDAAVDAMVGELRGRAERAVTYKLKDWGLSRQRYWGTPIPIVHCDIHGVQTVRDSDLPVTLPEDIRFTGVGPSPLTTSADFLEARCPACGGPARRETDTMDTFVDSSWYFLRYLDPRHSTLPFSRSEADAWMPVDLYIGGIEHATAHLVYARYFHKVLRDLGMVSCKEPFKKLICQGMVLKDGAKMSKSKGNVVDPDEVIDRYGADALRVFMTFASPIEKEIDWTGFEGIEGASRFLKRVTRFVDEFCERYGVDSVSATDGAGLLGSESGEQDRNVGADSLKTEAGGEDREYGKFLTALVDVVSLPAKSDMTTDEKVLAHKLNLAVKRVTDDLGFRFQFNTVVSGLMELANDISALPKDAPHHYVLMGYSLSVFVRLMSPVAPHLAEFLWERLGGAGFCMHAPWPEFDAAWLELDEQVVVVQVNGKVRGRVVVRSDADVETRKSAALACPEAQSYLAGRDVLKVIVPPGGKLVSVVVKEDGKKGGDGKKGEGKGNRKTEEGKKGEKRKAEDGKEGKAEAGGAEERKAEDGQADDGASTDGDSLSAGADGAGASADGGDGLSDGADGGGVVKETGAAAAVTVDLDADADGGADGDGAVKETGAATAVTVDLDADADGGGLSGAGGDAAGGTGAADDADDGDDVDGDDGADAADGDAANAGNGAAPVRRKKGKKGRGGAG